MQVNIAGDLSFVGVNGTLYYGVEVSLWDAKFGKG